MKFRERIGKRGVSPLIATVLLIGFAVALGAVIMNWGKAQLSTSECQKASIDFQLINDIPQVCSEGNSLLFYLINTGKVEIQKIKVSAFSGGKSKTSENIEKEIELAIADTQQIVIPLDEDPEFIRLIKVIPIIEAGEEQEYCTEEEILVQMKSVPKCQ